MASTVLAALILSWATAFPSQNFSRLRPDTLAKDPGPRRNTTTGQPFLQDHLSDLYMHAPSSEFLAQSCASAPEHKRCSLMAGWKAVQVLKSSLVHRHRGGHQYIPTAECVLTTVTINSLDWSCVQKLDISSVQLLVQWLNLIANAWGEEHQPLGMTYRTKPVERSSQKSVVFKILSPS